MLEPESIISIKNISKTYEKKFLEKESSLLDVSCEFPKGMCTALLGHNGAGKTSTIKIILGLLKADTGDVLFNKKKMTRQMRDNIGYMPETNKLPLELTAIEILRVQASLVIKDKDIRAHVEQKLYEVGLSEHRNLQISKMSKGMGRRLAWALANVGDPEVLILDEPFEGLDPIGREKCVCGFKIRLNKNPV